MRILILAIVVAYLAFACWWVIDAGMIRTGGDTELLHVSFDPTRDMWRDINAEFIRDYRQKTGKPLRIRQSHGGSSSQARSVIDGLDADVVTLALFSDTDAIRKAGRLQDGWQERLPNRSLPYTSTIVMVVRQGNPKQIHEWKDLERTDVQVICPNPKTSGNGKWAFLAMWGSVITNGGSEEDARQFMHKVYQRIPVFDASARGSTMTFSQKQLGDVHLTWENEAHLEVQEAKGKLEIVYPQVSIIAEPHVALVDAVVDAKGTREISQAYLEFLYTPTAQQLIANHYFRPTSAEVLAKNRHRFPEMRLFSFDQLAPTWDELNAQFFADGGLVDQLVRSRP
ncbi:MAG: sulfate ABC transporter substrate-binding protein [Zavarzinella sp.]